MVQRTFMAGLLALALGGLSTGCCTPCGPCHGGVGGYGHGACGGCDPCGDPCGGCCGVGLLGLLHKAVTCGSGCGEVYVDEWISHPPDCCDPCDGYGHYTPAPACGPPGCCPIPFLSCLNCLWGVRYHGACEVGCGDCCAAGGHPGPGCGPGGCADGPHGHVPHGPVPHGPVYHDVTPSPADPPTVPEYVEPDSTLPAPSPAPTTRRVPRSVITRGESVSLRPHRTTRVRTR